MEYTLDEVIKEACGYDVKGQPASVTQITFGTMPTMKSDEEQIEDLLKISALINTDAILSITARDNFIKFSWDFSTHPDTLAEIYNYIDDYWAQYEHTSSLLSDIYAMMTAAEERGDEAEFDNLTLKMRTVDIPFCFPTIVPTYYQGAAHIGVSGNPKFIEFAAEKLNEQPYILSMFFDINDVFVGDDEDIEYYDQAVVDEENTSLYSLYEGNSSKSLASEYINNNEEQEEETKVKDKKLKGVRFR